MKLLTYWRQQSRLITEQSGVVGILGVLAFSSIIVVVGSTMVATSVANYQISGKRIASTQSVYHAESGAEDALMQIKRNSGYGSTATTLTTTFNATNRVDTSINTVSGQTCASSKEITAAGYVGTLVRKIQLNNCPTPSPNIDFVYAMQAGANGITMSNNSTINGSSYTNGNHTGGSGSTVTGDVWVAGAPSATATPAHDPASPAEFLFGRSTDTNKTDVAQSFIADTTSSSKLIKVQLKVRKFGNPSNATVRIVTDNANTPSSTEVASGTLVATTVGLTHQFIDVSMTSPPTLTSGTKYWIVIDTSSSATNYWSWNSQNGYANGKGMSSPQWQSSGSMTWNDTNADFAFKAFMGAPATLASGLTVGNDIHANTITGNTVSRDAYYQTNNGSSIGRTSYPGSPDPPTRDLPVSAANIQDLKDLASAGTLHTGDYTVPSNSSRTIGPMKITGNLLVENNAELVLTGTLWVQGTIIFINNAEIRLDPGYGSDSGAIVSDGTITISNNVSFAGSGNSDSFVMLATTSTSNQAIYVSNNAASIILAAIYGTIHINNNGGANALAANGVSLANNATITYVSGLADVQFSAGPGGSFQAKGWREVVLD